MREKNIGALKEKLDALRHNAVADKEQRDAVRQRIRRVCETLDEYPPNVELALRYLRKGEKM